MPTTIVKPHHSGVDFYAPAFEVKMRGAPMPREVVRDVIEVTYEDSLDKIDSFTFVLNAWDATSRSGKYFGLKQPAEDKFATLFEPGVEVELSLGYHGSELQRMVTGYITTVELDLAESAAPRLLVRGLSVLDRFRTKQYSWSWPDEDSEQQTIRDSDIAEWLQFRENKDIGRPGLPIYVRVDEKARDREPRHEHVLMKDQYPIVFLMERARRLGYSIFVEKFADSTTDVLYFGPPKDDIAYHLEWGRTLSSFKPSFSTTWQVAKVTVRGWDRKAKQSIEGVATVPDHLDNKNPLFDALAVAAGREEVVSDRPVGTQDEADRVARRILNELRLHVVEASGATVGLPGLRAGRAVYIGEVDYRLDGRYQVTSATHTVNDSGYRTSFTARLEKGRS